MRQSYSQPLAFSYVSGIRTIIIWYAVVSVETCVISACFHRVHQSSLILSETSSSAFYLPILSLVKSLFYSFAPGGFGAPWTSGVGDHILVGPFWHGWSPKVSWHTRINEVFFSELWGSMAPVLFLHRCLRSSWTTWCWWLCSQCS